AGAAATGGARPGGGAALAVVAGGPLAAARLRGVRRRAARLSPDAALLGRPARRRPARRRAPDLPRHRPLALVRLPRGRAAAGPLVGVAAGGVADGGDVGERHRRDQ